MKYFIRPIYILYLIIKYFLIVSIGKKPFLILQDLSVYNIAPEAVRNLRIYLDHIEFDASFSGQVYHIVVKLDNLLTLVME